MEYAIPDLKPLPNVISIPSEKNIQHAKGVILEKAGDGTEDDTIHQVPDASKLAVLAAIVLQEVAGIQEKTLSSGVTSHSEMLLYLYNAIIRTDQNFHTDNSGGDLGHRVSAAWSRQLTAGLEKAMSMKGSVVDGATQKMFWAQQFMMTIDIVAEGEGKGRGSYKSFSDFLYAHPKLAYDKLPLVYYSGEVWESKQAKEFFMAPDLQIMQAQENNSD